jgi:PAS domain-containing protein
VNLNASHVHYLIEAYLSITTKNEILLDKSLNVSDAGIFSWVLSTDTVYADAAVAALFGFEAQQLENGRPIVSFLDRIDPRDKARTAQRSMRRS